MSVLSDKNMCNLLIWDILHILIDWKLQNLQVLETSPDMKNGFQDCLAQFSRTFRNSPHFFAISSGNQSPHLKCLRSSTVRWEKNAPKRCSSSAVNPTPKYITPQPQYVPKCKVHWTTSSNTTNKTDGDRFQEIRRGSLMKRQESVGNRNRICRNWRQAPKKKWGFSKGKNRFLLIFEVT